MTHFASGGQTALALAMTVLIGCSSSSAKSPTAAPDSGVRDTGSADSSAPTDSGKAVAEEASVADSAKPEEASVLEDSGDDGGGETYDFPCGTMMPCLKTTQCCAAPGATTTFSCTTTGACPMDNQILCAGPSDCSGTTSVCCAVEEVNGQGTYPNCTPSALGTSCTTAAACNTHLGQSCTDTTSVVLCHSSADCLDPNNPECCTFGSSSASLTFCIDSTTASLGGGQCN